MERGVSSPPSISAQPHPPAKLARVQAVDGLRGVFLVLMTLTHVTVPGGSILKAVHPDTISFIDSATGFVFVSGLATGLVYSGAAMRRGFKEAARRMSRRAFTLYAYAIVLLAMIAIGGRLIPGAGAAWAEWAGPLVDADWRVVIAAVALVQEAAFADILPMYIVFLLIGQAALWLSLSGRTTALLATSALIWAVVQVGATQPITDALAAWLTMLRPDLSLPSAFNLLAWQILFVFGLAAGVAFAQGRLRMAAIFRPEATYLFWLSLLGAAAIAATTLGFRLHHVDNWPEGSAPWLIDLYTRKERLGLGCLINILIFAYPTIWMLTAGVRAGGALSVLSKAFSAVVNWRFFRLLGRHSLQVYAWHVVLVYGLKILDARLGGSNPPINAALVLACLGLLAVPGLVREWWAGRTPPLSPPAKASPSGT